MSTRRMTGGEAVVATLQAQGVDVIFGIPGGHSLHIYDALSKQRAIRHVLGRHEQGLGFMADGYARASGRIGVLTSTSGPAVGNLAAALGGATTDTSAVLAIASTVRSQLVGKNRGGLHDCGEAIEIMRPVCRHVRRCMTVREIPQAVSDLIGKLRSGRPGGAYCEIPCDILGAEVDVEIPASSPSRRPVPKADGISAAVELLAAAQRPVIWAGTGSLVSGAGPEIEQLAKRLGAIVTTTTLSRGILPADHAHVVTLDGGMPTALSAIINEADVGLAVGTMFKEEDTAGWTIRPGERLIHIDIDPREIGRSYAPTVGIAADAKAALAAILDALPAREPADPAWVARGKRAEAQSLAKRREQGPVEMPALDILRTAAARDGILVCDRCNLGYWAHRCLHVYSPRTFQYPLGYGGLGGALPQAIGAKLACPEKAVVCVIGDGGFHFTSPELAVAVQEKVPITVLLCNNNAYGAIRAKQERSFGGRLFGCLLQNPDFQKLAAAYGIPAARADSLESLERHLTHGIRSNALNLVELTVELSDP